MRTYKPVPQVEKPCPICGTIFKGRSDKRVCSAYCRVKARRAGVALQGEKVSLNWRFSVLQRDGFKCRYCGRGAGEGAKLTIDHVIPWSKGGDNRLENLVTACSECNAGKGSRILRNLP